MTGGRLPTALPQRIPDVSQRRATRADVEWEELPDGRIAVHKRKFGPAASKVLEAFKVPPTLTVKLDTVGSDVWRLLDGRTVGDVLHELQLRHPDEEDLPERLGKYLSTMVSNELVTLP